MNRIVELNRQAHSEYKRRALDKYRALEAGWFNARAAWPGPGLSPRARRRYLRHLFQATRSF